MTDQAPTAGQPAPTRRIVRAGEADGPRVEREGTLWRIRSLGAAQQVLRARHATTQAGFTAEAIPKGRLTHHPILMSDGPMHDEQRKKVARFFAPVVVTRRYETQMEECADRLLDEAGPEITLDELALHYTVEVTAEVVGLTAAPPKKMAKRLVSFFNQPPFDITKPGLGRTNLQWAKAAFNGLLPIARFHLRDARPAIRARRREPQDDIISHLIAEGYSDVEILIECVTYGTAGMVTTREFICMAALHLLNHEPLRERYLAAGRAERHAILNEIIRLEPVVGHLYRRVQEEIEVTDRGEACTMAPGDLVDIHVRHANADPDAVGEDPLSLCPGRSTATGVNEAGLSFGDGAHKCPGQPLAILESDVLLTRLLRRDPRILREPEVGWDDLIAGYFLRGFRVRVDG